MKKVNIQSKLIKNRRTVSSGYCCRNVSLQLADGNDKLVRWNNIVIYFEVHSSNAFGRTEADPNISVKIQNGFLPNMSQKFPTQMNTIKMEQ
jgi:hypothetical protein